MEPKQHTFGGRGLDRYLIEYETDLTGEADVLGAATPPAAPAAEPVVEPAAAPAEPTAGWAPSREEWERTTGTLSALIEALQEDPAAAPPTEGQPEFAPEVHAFVEAEARKLVDAEVGPYRPLLDEMARERGQALVISELDKCAKGDPASGIEALGEFDRQEAAAKAMFYYQQTQDAQASIRAAAQAQIDWEKRYAVNVLERERQQMQARLDAGTEPGAGAGAAVENPTGLKPGYRDKYEQAAAEWEAKRRAQGSPVG